MFPTDVVIVAGARTPMARYTGSFSDMSAIDLAALASKEAIRRSGADPAEFDHAIFGNVMQTSADALYGARHVGLKAGLKVETPAVTVNRLCGSGIEAISQAAHRLLLGEGAMILAGGMENMTQSPFVVRGARTGLRLGGGALEDSLMAGLTDTYCGLPMALTAENLAEQQGITRKDADAYALRSQQAADAAYKACRMKEELVPVEVKQGKKTVVVSEDDHRRPDTTMEILEKLPPSFKKDGIVTAGNASGIVDGAAAVVVTREKTARDRGLKPIGRIVSWAVTGVDRASVPIDAPPVASELTRYLEDGWAPVIESDVDGPNSLPFRLDRENPNLQRYSATRRVARAVYMGSAPLQQSANRGISIFTRVHVHALKAMQK